MEESLRALVRQYLKAPDLNRTGCGMAGGALSPLLGALYLLPLDDAMQRLGAKKRIYYVRFIDDMSSWRKPAGTCRPPIRELIRVPLSLGLELHREKRLILWNTGFTLPAGCALPQEVCPDSCSPALRARSQPWSAPVVRHTLDLLVLGRT